MATTFLLATFLALLIEFLVVKKSSTLYQVIAKKHVSSGLKVDFFIWLMEIFLVWPVIGRILTLSIGIYLGITINNFLTALTGSTLLSKIPNLPLQIFIALALGDLTLYWLHRIFHKIKPLWFLHMYHHSTTEMTVFSASRDNPAVGAIWSIFLGVSSSLFGSPIEIPLWVIFINIFHTQIIHSKISSDWGIIGSIFISPQAHLIHHSYEKEHIDKNFGFLFTFWDRLFGTYYKGNNLCTTRLGTPDNPQTNFPLSQILINYKKSWGLIFGMVKNRIMKS
jgi:sterol desaturase/sphingolipid hydroxylase (fatty acid hydroxylase superfamily)